ncbi:hypothetical protein [Actinomadura formosensis]|uniref:hypothetical protein n=1 Tax=Actinomadura formosensis TaxID=60706 RepID=UPI003D89E72E
MTTEITRLLTGTGAAGERIEFTLTLDGGEARGSRFTGHYGTVRSAACPEVDCLYKVARGALGRRALENEVAVFSVLGWTGGNDGRFPELLGHDLDPDEGDAVLVHTRRGRMLARRASTTVPAMEQLWQPAYDLLSALKVLADHKYVHGAISSTTVFWDGEGLQIADLSTATTQTSGDDGFLRDVRNAAGLLYWFATGEDSSFGYRSGGVSPEQEFRHLTAHRPDLATVLRPVYEGASPTAEELLARMAAWPRPVHRPAATAEDVWGKKDGEHAGEETEKTHEIGAGPPPPPPPPRPDDREDSQFRKYLGERMKSMHGQPDRPAGTEPLSGPAVPRRPEPGTLPSLPSLPADFPFRVGANGTRRPHPLVWAAIILVALILLVVFA